MAKHPAIPICFPESERNELKAPYIFALFKKCGWSEDQGPEIFQGKNESVGIKS